MIHVRHGKGAKDRYVPLPERTLRLLRQYWKTHRNPTLLFPAEGRDHIDLKISAVPMSKSSVQQAFRAALKASGNNKRASVQRYREPLKIILCGLSRSMCGEACLTGSRFFSRLCRRSLVLREAAA